MSSAILLSFVFATLDITGGTPVLYAAEQKTIGISQEEAIQLAKKWLSISDDYKLERISYQDAKRNPFNGTSSWSIVWEKNKAGGVYATIDSSTGKLLQYSRFEKGNDFASNQNKVSEEKALEIAKQFLLQVASEEERAELSKPNEFGPLIPNYDILSHSFTFTRMVSGLPFLENGFQLTLGPDGEIVSFSRNWHEGKLPFAKVTIPAEKGQKLLEEQAAPSLVYKNKAAFTNRYDADRGQYQLVYLYNPADPQYVDAITGDVINAMGKQAEKRTVKALGSTIPQHSRENTLITKEEAQKIAEQLIKKLTGTYRSDGSNGGGTSSGPDGIKRRSWSFEFTPLHVEDKKAVPVQLSISDRGELEEYRMNQNSPFGETGRKFDKTIAWEQAEASALKLVNILYADRLGEISLLEKPSESSIKQALEQGRYMEVRFGWLKDGVPIENTDFSVEVNPETGEAESLWARSHEIPILLDGVASETIDLAAARKAEQGHKTFMLTYYLPQNGNYGLPTLDRQPMLVYRFVGDSGVVNARTGEWISQAEAQKSQSPQDIDDHPQKEALEFAVREGFLTVTDGKLEPQKKVTRGEMAQMMARMTSRMEFRSLRYSAFDDDEDDNKPHLFADVDQNHPQYGAIQKGVQYGLIPIEGKRFEPDKSITRAEAADMVARLLGYGDLLDKTEIFASAYRDMQKKEIPAVTLVNSQGLLPGKTATAFEPDASLTRAEAAQLMQALLQIKDLRKN